MFSAATTNTKLVKDLFDTVSQVIDEGKLKVKKEGIQMIATDRAMVAVIDMHLDASAFEEYTCDKEVEIGINILSLLTILKRAGAGDKLKLHLKEHQLEISLEGASTRNFAIPLLELSSDEIPPIGQLDFNSSFTVKAGIIEQGIADADIVADSVIFELSPDQMKMLAEGDTTKAELILKKGNEALLNINATQTVKSRYPIDYLKKLIKASKISDTVNIQIGADYPLKMQFKGDNASLTAILAPRVSED